MEQLSKELTEWETASLCDLSYFDKDVYLVEKIDEESNYILAIFTDCDTAINYAKEKNKEYIEYEKELWRELDDDLDNLNYILRTTGYRIMRFILNKKEDNRAVIFDTRDNIKDM